MDLKRNFELLPEFILRRPMLDYSDRKLDVMEAAKNPSFREALYYASPKLYEELLKFDEGKLSPKDTERMRRTLYKYYSRMCYRCTPFGSFSLCGVGRYAASMRLHPEETALFISIPPEVIHRFSRSFIRDCSPQTLRNMMVVANHTALAGVPKSKRISLLLRNAADEIRKAYLPLTSILKRVLRLARIPVSVALLEESIMKEFEIDSDVLLGYIRDLISKNVLISDLDISADVCARPTELSLPSFCDNRVASVRDFIRCAGKEYGIEKVNVNSYGFGYEIPESLKDSVWTALSLLWLLDAGIRDGMASFRRRFSERYEKREVPLLEALDDVVGLGAESEVFPSSPFMNAAHKDMKRINPYPGGINVSLSRFEKLILPLISSPKISLTDADLSGLLPGLDINALKRLNLPCSFSCMYKIVGQRDHRPVISEVQFSGRSAAAMLTRFAAENKEIRNLVESIMRYEAQSFPDDIVLAEVAHITKPSLANIQCRPLLREYAIPFVAFTPSPSDDAPIPVSLYPDDLTLSMADNRLVLRSKSLGKEVLPCLTTAYNPYFNSSPLYKFLHEIQNQYCVSSLTISTQGLSQLFSHLPRVEYDNIILSPEWWKLSVDSLKTKEKSNAPKSHPDAPKAHPDAAKAHSDAAKAHPDAAKAQPEVAKAQPDAAKAHPDSAKAHPDAAKAQPDAGKAQPEVAKFIEWCRKVGTPRFLRFNRKDNFLVIDCTSSISIEAFLDEVRNEKEILLTEFLPLAQDMEHYEAVAEIIHPLMIRPHPSNPTA